ncbi:Similar to S.cerevisiae protein UTP11 (Subunit of U3-containing Small Subunit (SSU) processome complex) [Malassezia sympodialis ATCC 42132]|uniref:Similar to S.cerevisiae protein UTP11 (Subunit of U3-containing Small Subunit (SSU) processome complex) n=1 Tax=Malassezia sympodialis (strain ATCC 42132) TaxID=1230383 RepID=A0A1M8AAE0_MALS4|nr:Similar to S.cerevisiae protein UTP11 (Subunit of U3-containing Small Subunit (SSU) processome complex) [Malassezia sympodialis ATCC 42132]
MALRNYVQRRNHKERGQLAHRKHLGLLEKHKDYVQRARDHHAKRDKLQRLRQKAADKNQDEFYLGMVGKKTEKGVHVDSRGNRPLDNDVVSLLKTQDAGYVRKQIVSEKKKLHALIEEIAPRVPGMRIAYLKKKPQYITALRRAGLLGAVGEEADAGDQEQQRLHGFGKKTVWVDSVNEMKSMASKSKKSRTPAAPAELTPADKVGERQLGVKIRELASRQHRLDALAEAANKLDVVRTLMRTRGSHAVPKRVVQQMKDDVAKKGAQITSKGLVVTTDADEDDVTTRTKKQYKWSNERKK